MRKIFFYFLMILTLGMVLLVKYFGPWETGGEKGPPIRVFFVQEKKTVSLPLEEYLVGVLAAEMPAEFEKEALKAQAIAARTYALKKIKFSTKTINQEHPNADVCTDPGHCQGWLSEEEMKKKWGWLRYWEYQKKLKAAVKATCGEVATYEKQLIDPVYHSTCGGRTENSEEVWTYATPYLKSVPCKWDQDSPKYRTRLLIPFSQLSEKLGGKINNPSAFTIKALEKTKTGRLKTILVGNKRMAATEFRRIFGINSTNFTWKIQKEGVELTIVGYGHGVGMCQFGANGLAKEGYNAEKILKYYYQGIEIEKLY
ncbi:stage II sporulation protein D [Candidatus Formimonas warabiya]|uniref:Stage II sporulation protein D n=1 Tax=Formimonas warabiya TaxID=1761012 RepID=A0A3G1KTY6_FORW1|nr:stage II sporulation protein D [Candidatus Formimonas warabiya]ATW25973.1 stage II sporulation protein D [Candidatus Formimonas warabiya]